MMLTSDIALSLDPTYSVIAKEYADDIEVLNRDFAAAFYKLVTIDMGPSIRCIGDLLPDPQPFQNDLPPAPTGLPDFVPIRASIEELLKKDSKHSDAFINLAYQCASTYRESDHTGGCNGARIRHSPENEWPENAGTQEALATLEEVKDAHSDVSYADLIVLAGVTALELENDELDLPFCGGAVDAETGVVSKDLSPRKYKDALITVLDDFLVKGLTKEEGVALASRKNVGCQYYKDLLDEEGDFSEEELALLKDQDLKEIVKKYARDEDELLETFTAAWTKMMTADRFLVSTFVLIRLFISSCASACRTQQSCSSIPRKYRTTARTPVLVFPPQPLSLRRLIPIHLTIKLRDLLFSQEREPFPCPIP